MVPVEIQELIDSGWCPWWKQPVLMSDWESIEHQAWVSRLTTTETHKQAVNTNMPQWFIEIVARSKDRAMRRHQRIRKRISRMKSDAMLRLLENLGLGVK